MKAMSKKTLVKEQTLLLRDLENAAIYDKKRNYFLQRALNKYITFNHLYGIAFIRFSPLLPNGYTVIYVGKQKEAFMKWIEPLLSDNFDDTMIQLANSPPKQPLENGELTPFDNCILLRWDIRNRTQDESLTNLLYEGLKAVTYVELKEAHYFYEEGVPFDEDVTKAIQEKDRDGIIELLSMTKLMSDSDITFWGEADSRELEVDLHIGSKHKDFGFLLPVGEGIGGLAAKNKTVLQVPDYKNCPYRYKDVSDTVDSEKIRTVFALPLKDKEQNTSGILYIGNRTINPLPLEKKFLLLRLGNQLEPLVKRKEITHFFKSSEKETFFRQKKAELRKIGQTAKQVDEVTDWLATFLKGDVLLIDSERKPFNKEEIVERNRTKQFYSFPLEQFERNLGKLYIWTNVKLPIDNFWPDLIDDVIHTIFIIHERNERYYYLADLERSQWLHNMLQPTINEEIQYQKGVKLQLPVDEGEIWVFHCKTDSEVLSMEKKMALEDLALRYVRQPIYFNGSTGFMIFNRPTIKKPAQFRDELLKIVPVETWLIHGAMYRSFDEMHHHLTQLNSLIETTIHNKRDKYVLTYKQFGLDYLLSNPRVATEIQSFANEMLKPILQYDKEHNSDLTETLALSLVHKSPSVVAEKLYVHPNTVHYRVNRAKQLLKIDETDVKNEIALTFAAYAWLYKQSRTRELEE